MLIKSIKACLLLTSLFMLVGAVSANTYEFGSKVMAGDVDENNPLNIAPAPLGVYYAEGPVGAPGLTGDDIAYLHPTAGVLNVLVNDVRLTPFQGYPAGTKVRPGDLDAGLPILAYAGAWTYLDLFGTPLACDIEDPVYYQPAFGALALGDLRLSKVQSLLPGTWVKDSDVDFGQITIDTLGTLSIRSPNNVVYDYPDSVYLDIDNDGNVSPGDLRLTTTNGHN